MHVDGNSTGEQSYTVGGLPDGSVITCECSAVPPNGACCFDADGDGVSESCTITTENSCLAQGGTYHGDGTNCGSFGACCYDADGDGSSESCAEMDETCCEDLGGTFQGASSICTADTCDCSAFAGETIILRSGNGPIGSPDSAITVWGGPGGVPLSGAPFTAADFGNACSLGSARVVAPFGPWIPFLPSDTAAKWIASNPSRSPASALYCYEFEVCCDNIQDATLDFFWAVDDQLGDTPSGPNNPGVYINGVGVPISGGNFLAEYSSGLTPITLVPGTNTLHVYQRDVAYVVSALMFSAKIQVYCGTEACCFPDGTCQNVDACCCKELGGMAQGAGTDCTTWTCPGLDCEPLPDGSDCSNAVCEGPDEQCDPKCVNFDPITGATHVVACDCLGPNDCRVGGGPLPAGPGRALSACNEPDDGSGTVTLPPPGCPYLTADEVHEIVDGLPPGTEILLEPIHAEFVLRYSGPGGSLGGEFEFFDSILSVHMTGTGLLSGYERWINVPVSCETNIGPRTPGEPVQSFPTEMVSLEGAIFGDPDFDQLTVRGGAAFGLPSPGQTTLTRLGPPGSDFNVDSFFDITYQIEFQGAPGSVLDGYGGTTTATVRMQAGFPTPKCVGGCAPGEECEEIRTLQADGTFDLCCECKPAVEPCLCGDIDRSGGAVDLADFATFALCFGLAAPSPPGCDADAFACSDLNGDGVVNLADFATFATWFGLTPTQTVPDCLPVQ